ncbi:MAG: WD40 repeat domain-containing serine/threonine-protein kinase, partial [Planctomycetota bacterium]
MNAPSFDEFLKGTADEASQKRCEDLLANPDTVVQCAETVGDDSLLSALRTGSNECSINHEELEQLTQKIEGMVPRHSLSADELSRVLNPCDNVEAMGTIGRFEVVEFIASGGMGLVFRAVDRGLDREVCIKLLSPNHEFNAEAKNRFEREAREMAKMSCERIVTVLEVGEQKGLPYFVMPFQEGMTLRKLLDRETRLESDRAIRFARQIAAGLEYAHDRGLLHRDIKPDNLWVTPEDDIKLLDFGLAKTNSNEAPITRSGTVIGTPSYMSPEQVTGKHLDQRSDLFSTGVVLVEMLTGRSPFQRANLFSTLMSVAGEPLPIKELDPENRILEPIRPVVSRLLQKSPEDRLESASDLLEALECPESVLQTELTSAKTGNGIFRLVAAALAGFVLCAAAMAAWAMTDKGTLVVSTDDPDVKVQIESETVSISDPVSGRTYSIGIGETPLPSGLYQLEMSDESSGLQFSSQQMTIRRGEETIVTVTLLPPTSEEMAANTDDGESSPTRLVTPSNPAVWADPTRLESIYTDAGHAQMRRTIHALPAMTLADAGLSTETAISPNASVTEGINNSEGTSTIEYVDADVDELIPNSDRTLWAAHEDGFIRIYNNEATLISLLPSPGGIQQLSWDSSDPALLAFSCFIGDAAILKTAENSDQSDYRVLVWLVKPDGAKLVRSIETHSSSFALNRSYRVAAFDRTGLRLFRLDDDSSWLVPGTNRESVAEAAFSPDGRYVATYSVPNERSQISIWDLQAGQLKLAIQNAVKVNWSGENQRAAIFVEDPDNPLGPSRSVEIWSLADQVLERTHKPEELDFSNSHCAISPDLKTIAVALNGCRVLLTDTVTGQQFTIDARLALESTPDARPQLRWTSNTRLSISHSLRTIVWNKNTDGLAGSFADYATDETSLELLTAESSTSFSIGNVTRLNDDQLAVTGAVTSSLFNHSSPFFTLILPSLDPADGAEIQQYEFTSFPKLAERGHSFSDFFLQHDVTSPDGRYSLALGEADRNRNESKKLKVIDHLSDDRPPIEIADFEWISGIRWGVNGKFLILWGREWWERGSRDAAKVINLADWKLEQIDGLSDESIANAIAMENGFVVTVSYRIDRDWERELLSLDTESVVDSQYTLSLIDTEELGNTGRNIWLYKSGNAAVLSIDTEPGSERRMWEIDQNFQLAESFAPVTRHNHLVSSCGKYTFESEFNGYASPQTYSIVSRDETLVEFEGSQLEKVQW